MRVVRHSRWWRLFTGRGWTKAQMKINERSSGGPVERLLLILPKIIPFNDETRCERGFWTNRLYQAVDLVRSHSSMNWPDSCSFSDFNMKKLKLVTAGHPIVPQHQIKHLYFIKVHHKHSVLFLSDPAWILCMIILDTSTDRAHAATLGAFVPLKLHVLLQHLFFSWPVGFCEMMVWDSLHKIDR